MMTCFSYRFRLMLIGVALTAVLGGCAEHPIVLDRATSLESQHNPTWQAHEEAVRRVTDWRCIGRIAVRTKTEGGTVNLNWHQMGHRVHVVLNAPLNQGTVELIGRTDEMLIIDSAGHRELTSNPEASIEKLTGWKIPITALPDWIRGLPHDDKALIKLNKNNWLHTMRDDGWLIDYESYRPVPGHDLTMPKKITVSRDDIRLRLVIESWQINVNDKPEPRQ